MTLHLGERVTCRDLSNGRIFPSCAAQKVDETMMNRAGVSGTRAGPSGDGLHAFTRAITEQASCISGKGGSLTLVSQRLADRVEVAFKALRGLRIEAEGVHIPLRS